MKSQQLYRINIGTTILSLEAHCEEWVNRLEQSGIKCEVISVSDCWWMDPGEIYIDLMFDTETDIALFALKFGDLFNNLTQVEQDTQ